MYKDFGNEMQIFKNDFESSQEKLNGSSVVLNKFSLFPTFKSLIYSILKVLSTRPSKAARYHEPS